MRGGAMKPNKHNLANLPTKIELLDKDIAGTVKSLYIKRDDQTGTEFSGNKVRKLEFCVHEALTQQCNSLITCGGIQSNHARSTAAVAAKLGLHCHLVLRSDQRLHPQGNYLLDNLLGATIHMITAEDYRNHRSEIMKDLQTKLRKDNQAAYIIPEGASNGIGTFGYFNAYEEILQQELDLNKIFDTIVCAVGSGGTYAGLVFANQVHGQSKKIIGVNICDSADFFKDVTLKLLDDFKQYYKEEITLDRESLTIIDGNVGRGYALNTPSEMDFIANFARRYGVVLDPVYTGKAMRGLLKALEEDSPELVNSKNVLFIHTGGLFGLFPKSDEFFFGGK